MKITRTNQYENNNTEYKRYIMPNMIIARKIAKDLAMMKYWQVVKKLEDNGPEYILITKANKRTVATLYNVYMQEMNNRRQYYIG